VPNSRGSTSRTSTFGLEDDLLVVRAEKKFERKDEKENYHFMELSYGTFQRALRLPGPVNQIRFRPGSRTVC
jgi:HSP20 family protein